MKVFNKMGFKKKKHKLINFTTTIATFLFFVALLSTLSICITLMQFKSGSIYNNLSIATIEADLERIESDPNFDVEKVTFPSNTDYETIGNLEEVASYQVNASNRMLTTNLSCISADELSEYGLFYIKGMGNDELTTMKLNSIELKNGKMLTESENVDGAYSILISDEVAKKNKLNLNDTFIVEVSNPEDDANTFQEKLVIVGTFSPTGKFGDKDIDEEYLSTLLEKKVSQTDEHEHDENCEHDENHEHNDEEEHEHDENCEHDENHEHKDEEEHSHDGNKRTEFDDVVGIQQVFLLKDLDTIYMSNQDVRSFSEKKDRQFNQKQSTLEYEPSYILNSESSIPDFKKNAKSILPDYFTIYSIEEAFDSWMPHTINNISVIKILVIVLIIMTLLMVSFVSFWHVLKDKSKTYQHLLLGKNLTLASKETTRKNITFLSTILLFAAIIAPYISGKLILIFLTGLESSKGIYFDIQYYYKNLIDLSKPLSEYVNYSTDYLIGVLILYILSVTISIILVKVINKRMFEDVII